MSILLVQISCSAIADGHESPSVNVLANLNYRTSSHTVIMLRVNVFNLLWSIMKSLDYQHDATLASSLVNAYGLFFSSSNHCREKKCSSREAFLLSTFRCGCSEVDWVT